MTGLKVSNVNVHVQGVNVAEEKVKDIVNESEKSENEEE